MKLILEAATDRNKYTLVSQEVQSDKPQKIVF